MREASTPTPPLPDDPAALRALLLTAWAERDSAVAERDALAAERDALAAQNDRLRHLLLKLKRMQFGARSERLPEEQLQLGLESLEQAIAQAALAAQAQAEAEAALEEEDEGTDDEDEDEDEDG